jgi:hypothetical protein
VAALVVEGLLTIPPRTPAVLDQGCFTVCHVEWNLKLRSHLVGAEHSKDRGKLDGDASRPTFLIAQLKDDIFCNNAAPFPAPRS